MKKLLFSLLLSACGTEHREEPTSPAELSQPEAKQITTEIDEGLRPHVELFREVYGNSDASRKSFDEVMARMATIRFASNQEILEKWTPAWGLYRRYNCGEWDLCSEILVNEAALDFYIPFIVAHELGHALGWSHGCDSALLCVEPENRNYGYWYFLSHNIENMIADAIAEKSAKKRSGQPLLTRDQKECGLDFNQVSR